MDFESTMFWDMVHRDVMSTVLGIGLVQILRAQC